MDKHILLGVAKREGSILLRIIAFWGVIIWLALTSVSDLNKPQIIILVCGISITIVVYLLFLFIRLSKSFVTLSKSFIKSPNYKKQIIVAWMIGITVCLSFLFAPTKYIHQSRYGITRESYDPMPCSYSLTDWTRPIKISIVVLTIGGLLIYTLRNKEK